MVHFLCFQGLLIGGDGGVRVVRDIRFHIFSGAHMLSTPYWRSKPQGEPGMCSNTFTLKIPSLQTRKNLNQTAGVALAQRQVEDPQLASQQREHVQLFLLKCAKNMLPRTEYSMYPKSSKSKHCCSDRGVDIYFLPHLKISFARSRCNPHCDRVFHFIKCE